MENCIFCKIVNKEIASEILYEDDELIAFYDINPMAPVHILLVTKKHVANISDLSDDDHALACRVLFAAKELAKKFNLDESGFRLALNNNADGGQEVFHLHAHILGGKKLGKMC